jgi:O-antigen/teichoic acid export membrane protein
VTLLTRSLIKNATILFGSQALTSLLSLATVLLTPALLGDVGLGRLAFAQSIGYLLITVTVLGMNPYITREVARDRSRLPELLWASLLLRAPLCFVSAAVAVGLLIARGTSGKEITLVVVCALVSLATVCNGVLNASLQGLERMARKSLAVIVNNAIVLGLGIPLAFLTHSPLAFAWALVAGAVADLAMNAHFFWRRGLSYRRPSRGAYLALVRGAAPFLAMALSFEVLSQLDTIMLGLLAPAATVGWYAAAARLAPIVLMIPIVLSGALLPAAARAYRRDPEGAGAATRKVLELTLLLAVPMAAGLAVIAPRLFHFLHYPQVFSHSGPVLMLMAPGWAVTAATIVISASFLAAGLEGWLARIGIGQLVLSVILFAVLIPMTERSFGNGAIGAAAGVVAAEVVNLAVVLLLAPRTLLVGIPAYFGKVLLATAAMAGSAVLTSTTHVLLEVAAGAAAYAAIAMLLCLVRPRSLGGLVKLAASAVRSDTDQSEEGKVAAAELAAIQPIQPVAGA